MKRLLVPLLAALALPTAVNANDQVDNWFDNEWWRRDFEKHLKIPASEITDQNIDDGRIGACIVFIENNFPLNLLGNKKSIIKKSCKDLYKKYKNTLQFPKYYVEFFNQELVEEKCLNAKDYAGCMQYESGKSISNEFDNRKSLVDCSVKWCKPDEFSGNDNLGRPVLTGWYFRDMPLRQSSMQVDSNLYKVKVNNEFGRYIHKRSLLRFYMAPRAGTSGYTTTYGQSRTNCSGYGNSINCTTTPPTTSYIPGRAATPGGVREYLTDYIFDCEDKLYAKHTNGKIEKMKNIKGKNKRWILFSESKDTTFFDDAIAFCNNKFPEEINKLAVSDFLNYFDKEIKGKPSKRKSTDPKNNVNCDSPVWKNKPRCL